MPKSTFSAEKALMKKNMISAMEKGVIIVEADAKQLCPVDTGTLKRSITHEVIDDNDTITGVIGSNVEYAYWAEKKQPYLEPAVDQNIADIKQAFSSLLKQR